MERSTKWFKIILSVQCQSQICFHSKTLKLRLRNYTTCQTNTIGQKIRQTFLVIKLKSWLLISSRFLVITQQHVPEVEWRSRKGVNIWWQWKVNIFTWAISFNHDNNLKGRGCYLHLVNKQDKIHTWAMSYSW